MAKPGRPGLLRSSGWHLDGASQGAWPTPKLEPAPARGLVALAAPAAISMQLHQVQCLVL
ncbi:hypothetical protein CAL28_07565 [Bordetella genomosp. 11]|uniref:Uncharacterized protein n=1 Tax=Bordetella genomosp. 11 TaxID=1416808 RepID=A0A261UQY8_9BORD|nr:hypothetical protein CAL28_07565 [Bordetella genomosp. 11]